MEKTLKNKLILLKNDPRKCLKAIRLGKGSNIFCPHCNQLVHTDASTTELAKRTGTDTLLFFQKCPKCNHKLYWEEIHC